ncbi:hypothetical protein NL108_016835 [Boleophthalmus pectinirostris]|nr:hypothetical protein NL108_016835 [Boleophthalmus pectinirostris]
MIIFIGGKKQNKMIQEKQNKKTETICHFYNHLHKRPWYLQRRSYSMYKRKEQSWPHRTGPSLVRVKPGKVHKVHVGFKDGKFHGVDLVWSRFWSRFRPWVRVWFGFMFKT